MTEFENQPLEQLHAIRGDIATLRSDNAEIKTALNIIRAYCADQNAEQSHLNLRLATAELKIQRIQEHLGLREEYADHGLRLQPH